MGVGIKVLGQRTGRPVRLTASNDNIWKATGVTLAWPLVTPATAVTTLADDTVVQVGERVIEVGTLLCKVTSGQYAGQYAPYNATASDGRQTITRGNCGLVDVTIKDAELTIFGSNLDNDHIGVLEGGYVWKERLKTSDNGVTGGPTQANVLAAFPELHLTP